MTLSTAQIITKEIYMSPKIVVESKAFYHPYAYNPSFGIPIKITLDDVNVMSIYKLDNQENPIETIAQIKLTNEWIFDGGDATFTLRSSSEAYMLDFNPRVHLFLFELTMLMSIFSPKFKAGMQAYGELREALIAAGVRVQKHRVLLPIVIGVLIALFLLVALFGGIYLFAEY